MDSSEIKDWLSDHGKSREWLASQCHVKKSTVDGWLSAGRPIPPPTLSLIRSIMDERVPLNPKLDLDTFLKAQRKAEQIGITLDQWIESLIAREAEK